MFRQGRSHMAIVRDVDNSGPVSNIYRYHPSFTCIVANATYACLGRSFLHLSGYSDIRRYHRGNSWARN
jgi:hypothetical protein